MNKKYDPYDDTLVEDLDTLTEEDIEILEDMRMIAKRQPEWYKKKPGAQKIAEKLGCGHVFSHLGGVLHRDAIDDVFKMLKLEPALALDSLFIPLNAGWEVLN